jgi:integrase
VTPPELLATLRRIQSRGATYTPTRLREIRGQVFRYAIATGRATYNPAADLASAILPARVQHPRHHRETAVWAVPARPDGIPGRRRPDEARHPPGAAHLRPLAGAAFPKWDEVDVEAREWRTPAGRMKMAKGSNQAHVVPLSAATIRTLKDLREITGWSSSLFSEHLRRRQVHEREHHWPHA